MIALTDAERAAFADAGLDDADGIIARSDRAAEIQAAMRETKAEAA